MQLTPAQIGMSLMIDGSLPMMRFASRAEGIARGRQKLTQITREDFGYDPKAWHDYLIETNAGGYRWSNKHRGYSKAIESVLVDIEWQQAVAIAESESLLERFNDRDSRQRDAVRSAEKKWAGQLRRCPKCNTEFESVQDRGQCTNCYYTFHASHPEPGNATWWLEIT